jgi:Spy/CpxP family protein refolding chaperone
MQRFRDQVKPLHQQMLQNRQAAMRDAQAVLTPQQRQQVQQLIQERRGRRGRDGEARGERQPRRQRTEAQGS